VAIPSPLAAPVSPNPKPQPGAAEAKPHLGAPTTGQVEEAPAVPPPAAKVDHLRLAREAFNHRDWPRALAEGKSAVAAGGGAEAHALLGNTYFKMGRFAEAEASYGKAVALDPRNALLQERLGIARVRAQEAKVGKEN
jgi:cytochrome c-type biogenesis protein CcmH/NrfG